MCAVGQEKDASPSEICNSFLFIYNNISFSYIVDLTMIIIVEVYFYDFSFFFVYQ